MLYFDVTKSARQSHRSGLTRTSACLRRALRAEVSTNLVEVAWQTRRRLFVDAATREPVRPAGGDWLVTPELFSEAERPGFTEWLGNRACRFAALYYDSIPLKHPEWTWSHSVSRHPHYLRLLAEADRALAISETSARELHDYWSWCGVRGPEPVAIPLGADGHGRARVAGRDGPVSEASIVLTGIIEPRKNQTALLDAAVRLWAEGVEFSVTLVGRVNPEFGRAIGRRIRALEAADDDALAEVLARARFAVLPSLAEGCGLPVLEALWSGLPVLCSDLPAHRESARGGGCELFALEESDSLVRGLHRLLTDDVLLARLASEARTRELPVWRDTARALLGALG